MHGLEPTAADLVDRHCRTLLRQASFYRRLARGVLPDTGRQHLAENDFVYLVGRELVALQQRLDNQGSHVARRQRGQRTAKCANRRAYRIYYYYFSHDQIPINKKSPGL